ncbi:DUF3073 domain-containing protein [Cellulomonas sp. RIT-PI-Y]|jgi:hypothetical protein|uniref:DUF3073 domain-containing protein n=1 Tax=Cellulomonas sp. RIT-PI-Y TaxID=3035297 RepID=UPI0021DB36E5|nr:DUF3073 domain-containing protein [Cellulomonas sp. RIT-PI-Y]
MGRGRQKAKQTKVARELKYFSPEPDYRVLERELTEPRSNLVTDSRQDSDDEDDYSPWADER